MGEFINCQKSLSVGNLTLPWAYGGNKYAYAICLHCRCKNTLYDFAGQDDDD